MQQTLWVHCFAKYIIKLNLGRFKAWLWLPIFRVFSEKEKETKITKLLSLPQSALTKYKIHHTKYVEIKLNADTARYNNCFFVILGPAGAVGRFLIITRQQRRLGGFSPACA